VPSTLDTLREKARKGEITVGESINLAILEEMARNPTTTCKAENSQAVPKGASAREQRGVEKHATIVGSATQDNAGAGLVGSATQDNAGAGFKLGSAGFKLGSQRAAQLAAQLAADFAAEDNDGEAIAHTAAATDASALLKTSGVMTSADLKARLRARGVSEAEVPPHVSNVIVTVTSCADSIPCVHSASSSAFFARVCAHAPLCSHTFFHSLCARARVLVRTLRPLVGVACEADQLVFRAAASGGAVFCDQ
jgi:post-segregation antitoxin (ccd killing protein)